MLFLATFLLQPDAVDTASEPVPIAVPAAADDRAAVDAPPAEAAVDNGTDPTKVRREVKIGFEHLDARGGVTQETFKAQYTHPLADRTSLQLTVPLAANDALGRSGFGLGDLGLKLVHIPVVTRQYGLVVQAELLFNSASRFELGSGQTVVKATGIYARFLKNGDIFAPALVHSLGFGRDDLRSRVNSTTLDLYYVPKLSDPRTFVTIDPALTHDWSGDATYGALAVTVGRGLGQALGGQLQAYVKPTVLVGSERPANWSAEVGLKLLGF